MSRKFVQQYADDKGSLVEVPVVGIVLAQGTTKPTDATAFYAGGAIFADTDSGVAYLNTGTSSSCTFKQILTDAGTIAAATVTSLTATTLITDAIDASAAAGTLTVKANTQHAFEVTDASTILADFDSRNTVKNVNTLTITASNPTIASETAAHVNASLKLADKTITYTGGTATTSQLGGMMSIGTLTLTDSSAMTLTTASALHIDTVAAAGGSLTITNSRMISTGVSDAYLTNAGVWTDTACWAYAKEFIQDASSAAIENVLSKIMPKTWKYRDGAQGPDCHGHDFDRERVGIVYDDLPSELRAPGEEKAVSGSILASFALAALKELWEKNKALESRLAALEA